MKELGNARDILGMHIEQKRLLKNTPTLLTRLCVEGVMNLQHVEFQIPSRDVDENDG